jgi:cyanophycin synthetase
MLKNRLLEAGILTDQIEVVPDEQEANTRALEMAETGDLIMMFGDNTKRTWKQIIYFNSGAHSDSANKKTTTPADLPDIGAFELGDDIEIISDDRGVRIAREEGD